ncbi:MAG: hypothetical protein JWN71_5031, partial [Xanthobacteraceae bacterium]|nr:hypothetical protein [Xanthobacteraceae bacterium]
FTPTSNIEDTTNIVSVASSYTDAAGNAGSAGTSANYTVDTKAPTVSSVTMSDAALTVGDTSTVTITFSEAVTAFDNTDVTVQNGTLGTLTTANGGVTWTGTFTPTSNIEDTTNIVSVAATYTDAAGNAGGTGTSANYTVDTKAPTVASVTMSDTALKSGETSTVTITFSEAVSGFDNTDVTVQNGTLGTLTTANGGITWTGTFTPTTNIEDTTNIVSVASSYTDAAGNAGTAGTSGNYTIDTKAPTVSSVTMSDAALTVGETSTVTITFSEAVTAFDNTDVTVQNGTLGTLTTANGGITWTGTFTPTANINDATNVITVGTGYTDAAGNSGTGVTSSNYTVNTVASNAAPDAVNDTLSFGGGPTPPPSGSGWQLNSDNGHYYKFVNNAVSWSAAKTAAENAGGYLATITSAAEDTFVKANMTSNKFYWLGASDAGTEGVWKWVTGPEADTVFWTTTSVGFVSGVGTVATGVASGYVSWPVAAPGYYWEPNDGVFGGGSEDYLVARSDGWWNDGTASSGADGYVIEVGGAVTNGGVSEDAVTTFAKSLVLSNDTDANADVLDVTSVSATSAKGALVSYNSATGQFSYNPTNAATIQALNVGQSTTDTFTYTITDGHSGSDTATVTITVNGVNDAATITGASTGSVTEAITGGAAGTPTATGDLTAADVDNTADAWQAVASATTSTGGYGSYTMTAAGVWTYTLNNANATVNNLNNGETLTDTFTVLTADGTSKQVSITINGATDPSLPNSATFYNLGTTPGSSTGSAYDLNSLNFVKSNDTEVTNAATNPSVTISASGNSNQTDYYKLVVASNGTKVVFDIDHANFDSVIRLTKSSGSFTTLVSDDNIGDVGTTNTTDSYISATLNAGTYFLQVGRFNSQATDDLGNLSGSGTYELQVSVTPPGGDPIVLDLGNPGIALTSLEGGVQFDVNGDGVTDQVAWTAGDDGILAFDVDGSGKIENGTEIFSPYFAGGNYVDGLEALATLDSNHDGKIDSADADFAKLTVWQDVNHDGVSEAGELKSLADLGITGISLDATPTDGYLDGQKLLAQGTFTNADGTTGNFVEVDFDKDIAPTPYVEPIVANTDGNDVLIGTAKADVLIGGHGNDTLTGGEGADTFVFAEAGAAHVDLVTDYTAHDTIDISGLLDEHFGEGSNAADFIRLVNTDGNVTLQVDTDGAGSNSTWADVAVLQGYHSVGNQVLVEFEQQAHQLTVAA